ncbi:MAG: hypothetical protein AAF608_02975 [Pseudomonadota bacterium]
MPPFPRAHYYVAAFLLLTFAAFMPSYFMVLGQASFAHHVHGITATLWIVLLITQSWSIHKGIWAVHGWSGRASVALVPLFTAGGLLVTQNMLSTPSAFNEMFGVRLAVADLIATAAFVAFYGGALRNRRSPEIHARYMLSTVFLVIGPSLARFLTNYVPGFLVRSRETLPNFAKAADTSFIFAMIFCFVLVVRDARNGKPMAPFSWALAATVLMFGGYRWFSSTDAWLRFADIFVSVPTPLIIAGGIVATITVTYVAWFYPAQHESTGSVVGSSQPAE